MKFLKSWWSKTYNRPLKDPLLSEYTLYDLLYEYHDKIERVRATELSIEQETDKIEEERMDETLAWIEEEEAKEKEALEEAERQKAEEEEQWMLDKLKEEHGDDFGDDIDIDFSE